ncbi:MAG: Asp-tRNA(Asn)/Glu-tRNA(Gln) amidotransferase GatCAB subunit A [Flavobacteriales bacterium]|nr:MAG: Asp-tRNA(Asn)/Glu-tRNA(Gln) amidotransferase GatCAB subunit A [Flavobacteriales bacterium]
MEKTYTSLKEIQQDIYENKVNCTQLVQSYIARIEKNKHLNAFLEVFVDEAINVAKEVDVKIANGSVGKLAGMVIAIKDNICYKGHKISASSKILEGFESLFSATVIDRLLAEDAIIIGRTNCDEFAMGSSNENSAYGEVLNSIDNSKVSGGSSGGSAVAVKANLCLASLGSDTGGSIRQPASFCDIVGMKPTYGRVSRHGLIAYASSFDQIGPFTNNVDDLAILTEVMAGGDEYDSTCSQQKVPLYSENLGFDKKLKLTYFKSYIENEGLDSEIKARFYEIVEQLKSDGHIVEETEFEYLDYLVPTYYVLTTAEASSNLARYDGIHFGHRSKKATNLESTYKLSRTEGFGKEVKRRIMLGTYVLSAGFYDSYYSKAQKVRRLIQEKTESVLNKYDFILSPTSPHTAFDIGKQNDDQIKMYLEDIYTAQAPLSGIPALSLPLGQHSNGMPFGIQIMGRSFGEQELLAFSKYLMDNNILANNV